jgi:hypothetical protein
MEGCVPANCIDQFKPQLKRGSVYTLETFIFADAWQNAEEDRGEALARLTDVVFRYSFFQI